MRVFVLSFLVLMLVSIMAHAELAVNWDFDDETSQGWVPAHSLSEFDVNGGILKTRVTGGDPYLIGPMIGVAAPSVPVIELRLRSLGPSGLAIYFTTDRSTEFTSEHHVNFSAVGDDDWHVYRMDMRSKSPLWNGTIERIRLDIDGWPDDATPDVEIDWIRLPKLGQAVKVEIVDYPGLPVNPGQRFQVKAVARNLGGTNIPSGRLVLHSTKATLHKEISSESLEPLESIEITSDEVAFQKDGAYSIQADLFDEHGDLLDTDEKVIIVGDPNPQGAFALREDHGVVLSNEGMKVWFIKNPADDSWQRAVIEGPISYKESKGGSPVAWFEPMPETIIASAGSWRGEKIQWEQVHFEQLRDSGIRLSLSAEDTKERKWQAEVSYRLDYDDEGIAALRIDSKVQCSNDVQVLRHALPQLQVGRGSFGARKDEAIFPGLEWLVADEVSSSTLDSRPPLNLRRIPHPLKVTVPTMFLRHDENLISLHWDPTGPGEDPSFLRPQPEFQSPELNADYHVFGLSLPSVGQGLDENSSLASIPLDLPSGTSLRLSSEIRLRPADDRFGPVKDYGEFWQWASGAVRPRDFDEERALCRETWTRTRWIPEEAVFLNAWDNKSVPDGNTLSRLIVDKALGMTPEDEKRVDEVLVKGTKKMMDARGPVGIGYPACFVMGGIPEYFANEEQALRKLLDTREEDGGWRFAPTERNKDLGEPGDEAIGLNANNTCRLLRFARMTGDEEFQREGLKALEYMKKFSVPRAAQIWEIPVHSPDILASGQACLCYLEGYRQTGDEQYLELAKQWAATGLPFVYSWKDGDKDYMFGATIPIFGSTHYIFGWYGQPVQWCGLAYAKALLELSLYDLEFPWVAVAEAITISGMNQQFTEGEFKGTYPDYINVISEKTALHMNPLPIMDNLYAMRNMERLPGLKYATEPETVRVQGDTDCWVTHWNNRIEARRDENSLSISVSDKSFVLPDYILVAGIKTVDQVLLNGRALTTDVEEDNAYWYDEDRQWLVIRLNASPEKTVTIR